MYLYFKDLFFQFQKSNFIIFRNESKSYPKEHAKLFCLLIILESTKSAKLVDDKLSWKNVIFLLFISKSILSSNNDCIIV